MPHESAGVEIRELSTTDDLDRLTRIFDDVWHPDPTNRPVTTDMLRALSHAGNYVAGAFVGGQLAGGSVAFFGTPLGDELHSHITGVSRLGAGHRVGYALKIHQREWARKLGLSTITWTFDPLVARNAYFNITKLGAVPARYYRDFYGDIGAELGGTDESDRVLMRWSIASEDDDPAGNGAPSDADGRLPEQPDAAARTVDDLIADGAVAAIDLTDPDRPHAASKSVADTATVLIPVPRDIDSMRRHHPVQATRWRHALRDAMAPLLDDSAEGTGDAGDSAAGRPVGFLRSGWYVFGPTGQTATE